MRSRAVALSFIALTSLAACSSSNSKDAVRVTATDSACTPAEVAFTAGKTTFEVKNEGSKVTELYVYGEGDSVVGEVENVGPGTSRTLSVNLKAGTYQLACKPGQTGSGIRSDIKVEGKGGAQGGGALTATREVAVRTVDYAFELPDPQLKTGEVIKFELTNAGKATHEFEVLDPDGKAIGEVEGTAPGAKGQATMAFTKPGTYTYQCELEDHHQRGMHGSFTVA
jgi:uncharacterized cupredoxin-like copper-binding protein